MSLYDFDDVGKSKEVSWSCGLTPSINLMQSHVNKLQRNAKRQVQPPVPSKLPPVVDLKKTIGEGEYRFNHLTGKMEKFTSISLEPQGSSDMAFDDPLLRLVAKDEYNPLLPNDYEQISKMLREKRKLDEKRKEDETRQPDSKYMKYDGNDNNSDEEVLGRSRTEKHPSEKSRSTGTAIAPPPILLEDCTIMPGNDNERDNKFIHDMDDPEERWDAVAIAATQAKYGTTSAAAKIMVKMGFKEGKGLGKEGQGMSTALQVERTSRRGGKIIHEKDLLQQQMAAQQAAMRVQALISERTSNVILLRNMVGPGEVDDDLQSETAEECSKYGKVVTCMIFELQDVPDDQAVRIFVEFVDVDSALRAVLDINGRYFGGRIVSAGYYDSEKFKNLELGEEPWGVNE